MSWSVLMRVKVAKSLVELTWNDEHTHTVALEEPTIGPCFTTSGTWVHFTLTFSITIVTTDVPNTVAKFLDRDKDSIVYRFVVMSGCNSLLNFWSFVARDRWTCSAVYSFGSFLDNVRWLYNLLTSTSETVLTLFCIKREHLPTIACCKSC